MDPPSSFLLLKHPVDQVQVEEEEVAEEEVQHCFSLQPHLLHWLNALAST
jgi:hypothetical protein